MSDQTIVDTYTFAGEWKPVPMMAMPGVEERTIHEVTVFEADWYGKGPKLYVRGVKARQTRQFGGSPARMWTGGSWQDGNVANAERWLNDIREARAAE